MAPSKLTGDGQVVVPLDEHTRAIAEAAAMVVLDRHMATCPVVKRFEALHADFYGKTGEKGEHPGTIGEVQSLKEWRRAVTAHIVRLWAAALVVTGALIGPLWAWLHTKQ